MSSSLTWEPRDRKRKSLPLGLKHALQKRYGGTITQREMTPGDIGYLQGLKDAGIGGAQELIDAIEKHDAIILNEEF